MISYAPYGFGADAIRNLGNNLGKHYKIPRTDATGTVLQLVEAGQPTSLMKVAAYNYLMDATNKLPNSMDNDLIKWVDQTQMDNLWQTVPAGMQGVAEAFAEQILDAQYNRLHIAQLYEAMSTGRAWGIDVGGVRTFDRSVFDINTIPRQTNALVELNDIYYPGSDSFGTVGSPHQIFNPDIPFDQQGIAIFGDSQTAIEVKIYPSNVVPGNAGVNPVTVTVTPQQFQIPNTRGELGIPDVLDSQGGVLYDMSDYRVEAEWVNYWMNAELAEVGGQSVRAVDGSTDNQAIWDAARDNLLDNEWRDLQTAWDKYRTLVLNDECLAGCEELNELYTARIIFLNSVPRQTVLPLYHQALLQKIAYTPGQGLASSWSDAVDVNGDLTFAPFRHVLSILGRPSSLFDLEVANTALSGIDNILPYDVFQLEFVGTGGSQPSVGIDKLFKLERTYFHEQSVTMKQFVRSRDLVEGLILKLDDTFIRKILLDDFATYITVAGRKAGEDFIAKIDTYKIAERTLSDTDIQTLAGLTDEVSFMLEGSLVAPSSINNRLTGHGFRFKYLFDSDVGQLHHRVNNEMLNTIRNYFDFSATPVYNSVRKKAEMIEDFVAHFAGGIVNRSPNGGTISNVAAKSFDYTLSDGKLFSVKVDWSIIRAIDPSSSATTPASALQNLIFRGGNFDLTKMRIFEQTSLGYSEVPKTIFLTIDNMLRKLYDAPAQAASKTIDDLIANGWIRRTGSDLGFDVDNRFYQMLQEATDLPSRSRYRSN
ncbi:MAG: hypothetical protein IH840_16410, partial [Candidatus Heimdallarchaeota archaeon]|nr:hypothetical protein [Candidatus Heimdallarchaeota archaeon]